VDLRERRDCTAGVGVRPRSSAMANDSLSSFTAWSVLPSRKFRPPRLFVSWLTWTRSASCPEPCARARRGCAPTPSGPRGRR
jgi:hypothetical protein